MPLWSLSQSNQYFLNHLSITTVSYYYSIIIKINIKTDRDNTIFITIHYQFNYAVKSHIHSTKEKKSYAQKKQGYQHSYRQGFW